jgi:drug/metabolite transporter (DMT)-like permease
MLGYIFALLAMISFGVLGILSKLSDRRGCSPFGTTTVVFGVSTIVMAAYVTFFRRSNFAPPAKIIWVALFFGIVAVAALWVFLYGIRFGKITTSWVIINLSAAVPAVVSTLVYGEKIGIRRLLVLILVLVSILLLWRDMKEDPRPVDEFKKLQDGDL